MSKKTRQKTAQVTLEPMPAATLDSSRKAVWRRSGLIIAGMLFLLANLAFRMMDSKTIAPTAFPIILVLTISSIVISIIFGIEHFLITRRANKERWSKADWERWRNGFDQPAAR